jgi:phenylacetate-CoA ligase
MGRLRIGPRAIITTAEMLTDAARLAIADGFGVPPVNTFASTEGLVGHSDPGGTELTFATDMCLTELVDAGGRPVPPGTPSARVLVTNLHNFSQPMIRYELSDSFTACDSAGSGGPLRALVAGRDDGAFRYGAVVVHSIAVRTVMTAAPAVTEYQVRQTARGVDLDVVAAGSVDQRAMSAALAASLTRAGLRIRMSPCGSSPRSRAIPPPGRHSASFPSGRGSHWLPGPGRMSMLVASIGS